MEKLNDNAIMSGIWIQIAGVILLIVAMFIKDIIIPTLSISWIVIIVSIVIFVGMMMVDNELLFRDTGKSRSEMCLMCNIPSEIQDPSCMKDLSTCTFLLFIDIALILSVVLGGLLLITGIVILISNTVLLPMEYTIAFITLGYLFACVMVYHGCYNKDCKNTKPRKERECK